jgi:hypothetical protein
MAFLKARADPELWLHGKLVELGVLADPGPWLWQRIMAIGEPCMDIPDEAGTPTEQESMLLLLGLLLSYAGKAWALFGQPGGEATLLAFVRQHTQTTYATLDEAWHAAIAVGQRYGLVEGV